MRLTSNGPCDTKTDHANDGGHKRGQNDAHSRTSQGTSSGYDQRDDNYACGRKSGQNDAHGRTSSAYDQRDENYECGCKSGQNDAHSCTDSRGSAYNQRRDEN